MDKATHKEEQKRLAKEQKRREIEESSSYQLTKGIATVMDDYFLDPIIGLIPWLGDIVTPITKLPSIYVCLFKIRSIPLTLALVFNTLRDVVIGLIPLLGEILDFFHKSHKQNYSLIVGFVEEDKAIIKEINRKAVWTAILIGIFCVLIYVMILLVKTIIDWFSSLF